MAGLAAVSLSACHGDNHVPAPEPSQSASPVQPGNLGYREVDPRDLPGEAAGFVGDISGDRVVYRDKDRPDRTITVDRGSSRVIGVDFWESGYEEATRYRIGGGKGVCGVRMGEVSCMVQTEAFADVMLSAKGLGPEELKAPAEAIAATLLEARR